MVPGSVAKLHLIFGETPSHAARGLADFSHVWLLWASSSLSPSLLASTLAPNPARGTWPCRAREGEGKWGAGRLGVLATRSPNRPNPIGLTLCRLISVEGGTLTLGGVDLLDGTPVLDVKPYVPSYDSIPDGFVRVPDWLRPPPPITVEASLEVRELLHRLLPPAVSSSSSSASSSSSSSSAASLSAAAASTPGPLEQHGAPDPHMRTSLGLVAPAASPWVEEVIRADTRSRLALSRTARRPSAHPSHPSSDPSSDASEAGGDDERDLPRPFNFMVRDVRIEYRLDTLPSNQALDTLSSNQAAPAGQALDIRTVATILSAHRCLNATAGSY
ncbi:TsaA-like domain-containing protein [Baffinella frigidus]|nr:TsaA-like domain-containing protein [Cryptophyta sp. CCMP2293]